MTETPNPMDDTYQNAATTAVPMENAELGFLVNVSGVKNLGEAIDKAAINLLRYGLDDYFILVTDTDTGEEYVVHDGAVVPSAKAMEVAEAIAAQKQDSDGETDESAS